MKRRTLYLFAVVTYLAGGLMSTIAPVYGQAPPREMSSFRDIVKMVLPAVVSIEASAKTIKGQERRPIPFEQGQAPEEFRRFPDLNQPPREGIGSGFFVDAAGVVLTNFHVVDGAERVTVTLADGRKFHTKNIRGDRSTDLAIVILDHRGPFPTLTLGDSDAMEIGDRVLAVGAPFGLTGSVTSGIISAKGRNGLKMNQYEDFLQTDAAINPGNSGGPLVNLDGQVVGINAAIKSRSGGFQGVGLAAASNLAKRVVMALRTDGVVRRGYLGVQIRELSVDVATRLKVPDDAGIAVAQVFENTPAARGGLREGDIIINLAGKRIKDANSFQRVVAYLPLKQVVEIQVLRDRQPLALNVTVEEQPKEFSTIMAPAPRRPVNIAAGLPLTKLGMDIAELSDTSAEDLGFRAGTRGVLITRVAPDSIAADAGLKNGMLITKIEDRTMTTAAQVRDAVQAVTAGDGLLLQVQSPQGGTNYVLLKMATGQ